MLIYFLVLSSTRAEFFGGFFDKVQGEVWYSSKPVYLLFVGITMLPIVVKKEVAELKWLAWLLSFCIGIFILMSLILLVFDSRYTVDPTIVSNIWWPKKSINTFGAFCTIIVAYGY